ncbi:MAG: hypothetical protein HQK97_12195 [Nitrospirae bacterium]|nr:hypothetical protein [Nitrospirota bacterium]
MTIGQGPVGISGGIAVGNSKTNDNAKQASTASARITTEKTPDSGSTASEAYTLGISASKLPALDTLATSLQNETEAMDSAVLAKKTIMQNPDNAVGSLRFNMSRIAGLFQGLTESPAT